MKHWLAVAAMATCVAGCGAGGGPAELSRSLGPVKYEDAFAAAEAVFARHFEIASADSASGTIESQPKHVDARGDRVLGNSPARQFATMRIAVSRGQVFARLRVIQQRQGSEVRAAMSPAGEPYSSVPNQSPAERTAATTDEQNSLWRDERRMQALEARILQELYEALNPPATEPATAAATEPSR